MLDELMKIGDEVVITIAQENRDWGYNPCPDGTKATILGFSEMHYGRIKNFGQKPGVYVNRSWVNLRFRDGREHQEWSGRLECTDKVEYEKRLAEYHESRKGKPFEFMTHEFIRELPETPFWEGDFVRVSARMGLTVITGPQDGLLIPRDPSRFQIVGIKYESLDQMTMVNTKYPAYDISDKLGAGWHTATNVDEMTLLERGPVWKYYHQEPIVFSSLKEEADFFTMLGRTKEVRNPASGNYAWTKEEIIEAIKKGTVHGMHGSSGFLGGGRVNAGWFLDEELGKRVAKATLEGFGVVPV